MRKIIGIILVVLLSVSCFVRCSISERTDTELLPTPRHSDTIIITPWNPQGETPDYPLGH